MSKIFRKKYLNYPAGIVGKDDDGKTRVKQVQHSTSAPVVYVSDKWGGKWARIDTFDVQSIELRSASAGEDICIIKYRYGHIAYPNAPDKQWKVVNTKRFTGKTMWVRVMEDKLILFQGVLTNVDDEFYGRGKDNDAGVESGVQTFTFKGGLYLLGRFRFYKSFWHSDGGLADEVSPPEDKTIDWIPDFGGESPEYSASTDHNMEIQNIALGNMTIYEKEVKDSKGKVSRKIFTAFGGSELFSPEGAFAYLLELIDMKKWSGPKFDVNLRYISGYMAEKQISSEPVMNARDFLLDVFDTESGYDFYFEPSSDGYTIIPFPRENNKTYFWINPRHTAVVNCTLSRNMDDYYTAVRVIGERVIYNVEMKFKPNPVRSPLSAAVDDEDEDGSLCMFDAFRSRTTYKNFSLLKYSIDEGGEVKFSKNEWIQPFLQTKYREVLTDFYYDITGKEVKENVPKVLLDGRAYNRAHGGNPGDDSNVFWTQAHTLEVGVEPFKQAIGFSLKVKHWTRLLDGSLYSFDGKNVIQGNDSDSEDYENRHKPEILFPVELRENEVPDINMREVLAHFAFEADQRFQYIFGKYEDEYRTLTVYEKDARLIVYYDLIRDDIDPVVCRNDFDKLKRRYEAILKEYKNPTAEITCQIKGILSPAILGKRITVASDNVSQDTETSLTHISYVFPEGKAPQTRL